MMQIENEQCSLKRTDEGIPFRAHSITEQEYVGNKTAQVLCDSASHCHSNLDFRFNSQSTAMQFTETQDYRRDRLDFNSAYRQLNTRKPWLCGGIRYLPC